MATEPYLAAAIRQDRADSLTPAQKEALEQGVAKIVVIGEQVGVTTDQMIELLKSGLTVGELLEYLEARSAEVASGLALNSKLPLVSRHPSVH